MKRDYENGKAENVDYFFGIEVEHTPAYGLHTLFVTGLKSVNEIEQKLAETTYTTSHVFFGANHSYRPITADDYTKWDQMIMAFLDKGLWCSLDIPVDRTEMFLEGGLNEYNNFIPQIRVPLPYVKLWNYNATIKLDDKDFEASNPGVWSHSLHTLMDRQNFTHWMSYKNDKII